MPRNLELKARVRSVQEARRIARRMGSRYIGELDQTDTFLLQGNRRLKVREQSGKRSELIYYSRSDMGTRSGRVSSFIRVPLSNIRRVVEDAQWDPAKRIIVRKKRHLFLFENTRIHIDTVRSLGGFIEFEVLVLRGRSQARRMLSQMVRVFRIRSEDVIPCAYADLLRERLQA